MIAEMLKLQEIQLEKQIPEDLEISIRPNQIREVLYNILYYYSENQKKDFDSFESRFGFCGSFLS